MTRGLETGPHLLTYRQTEYTFGLVAGALGQGRAATGCPRGRCRSVCDDLLEASVPEEFKDASTSLAVDWTDLGSFSRPPPPRDGDCADPEASWGHRKNNLLRSENELFFGYYLSAAVMMPDENGPARPRARPPRHPLLVPARPGPRPGPRADRDARGRHPARRHPRRLRLRPPRRRRLGDPAPPGRARSSSRTSTPTTAAPRAPTRARSSPTGTCTARAAPRAAAGTRAARPPRAAGEQAARRTTRRPPRPPATSSAASPPTTPTATTGCSAPPPWARSAAPSGPTPWPWTGTGPRSSAPPEHPQACCTQQTITVPPEINAKTAQKHDYPSAAHRRSYARRTGAERGFATVKDPAANDIARGWCRLMGLAPLMLFTTTPADRPQPAHPGRLEHPAGRKPAPRRQRPARREPGAGAARTLATLAAAAAALDPARPRAPGHRQREQPAPQPRHAGSTAREPARRTAESATSDSTRRTRHRSNRQQRAGMSDPNVKMVPTET